MAFREDFVWGAAISAYQVEGATKEDGKGEHIWDVYTKEPGHVFENQSGDVACDHYHRFAEDVGLMKEMGLKVKVAPYASEHKKPIPRNKFPNLLHQDFHPEAPNVSWVSDITYVKVKAQYMFVCVVIDLFSRRVLSYGISDTIDTVLTINTFDEAFEERGRPENLLFHSDQGVQYTAFAFRTHLEELKCRQSFSSPGYPYDNSVWKQHWSLPARNAVPSIRRECQGARTDPLATKYDRRGSWSRTSGYRLPASKRRFRSFSSALQ